MTHLEWVWLAKVYEAKEQQARDNQLTLIREVYKSAVEAFRETLIHLGGLNIGAVQPEDNSDAEDSIRGTSFIPMVLSMGQPEIVSNLVQKHQDRINSKAALNDPNLEVLNKELMTMDFGDLEPLLFSGMHSSDPAEQLRDPAYLEYMKSIGVEVIGLPEETDENSIMLEDDE